MFELYGWDEAAKQFKWADDHYEEIVAYALQRMAQDLAKMVGPSPYLHLVRVSVPGKGYVYGISIEPEPKRSPLGDLSNGLLYFATGDESIGYYDLPYVSTHVPEKLITQSHEDGFFYFRNATNGEIAEWATRNQEYLESEGLTAAPLDSLVWFVEDVAYNVVRAEYGFGEKKGRKVWRKSLRKLRTKTADKLSEEIAKTISDMDFPVNTPSFETRSLEWLEQNERAMLVLAGG